MKTVSLPINGNGSVPAENQEVIHFKLHRVHPDSSTSRETPTDKTESTGGSPIIHMLKDAPPGFRVLPEPREPGLLPKESNHPSRFVVHDCMWSGRCNRSDFHESPPVRRDPEKDGRWEFPLLDFVFRAEPDFLRNEENNTSMMTLLNEAEIEVEEENAHPNPPPPMQPRKPDPLKDSAQGYTQLLLIKFECNQVESLDIGFGKPGL